MKLIKPIPKLKQEECKSVYYSNNLRITVDKSFTRVIVPPTLTLEQEKFLMFLIMNENGVHDFQPRKCNLRYYAEVVVEDRVWNVERNIRSLIQMALSLQFAFLRKATKETSYYSATFFESFEYTHDENGDPVVYYSLHPFVQAGLIHKGKNFAEIHFSCVLSFDSVHALRLYRFLCGSVHYGASWKFQILQNELAYILGVPQLAENYREFNRSVLKPAEKEVTEKSDIQVNHSKKRGNKKVDFDCHRDKRRDKLDRKGK